MRNIVPAHVEKDVAFGEGPHVLACQVVDGRFEMAGRLLERIGGTGSGELARFLAHSLGVLVGTHRGDRPLGETARGQQQRQQQWHEHDPNHRLVPPGSPDWLCANRRPLRLRQGPSAGKNHIIDVR